ncbi:MAG: hypothetical protein ACI90V_006432, partial [Bacillariaceae sp.]
SLGLNQNDPPGINLVVRPRRITAPIIILIIMTIKIRAKAPTRVVMMMMMVSINYQLCILN